MSGLIYELAGNQRQAAEPRDSVWLSASAGTGKTQVLSARVLRLLLEEGNDPSQILCLTFTKAGAAEMAERVNSVLARWVRLEETRLGRELLHIGAPNDPATRARARSLFASVLDCPGGGLRIDTIHAFAQWLLSAFPQEAGIQPGTRAMEDRERDLLAREVLGEMLVEAEAAGDQAILAAVAEISRRKGPDGVMTWLMRCAGADLWDGPGGWQPPMRPRVCRALGIPPEANQDWLAAVCADAVAPLGALRGILAAVAGWKAQTAANVHRFVSDWLAAAPPDRLAAFDGFYDTVLKKNGEPRKMDGATKNDPAVPDYQSEIAAFVAVVEERRTLLALADFLAPALELGRSFALRWDAAKAREGLVDFDDLIRKASALLTRSDLAGWIRYKLDRQLDHILVDEAQDTNAEQWRIILDGLIGEFFAGEGARGTRLRTVFAVGDYKQAIFRFQGTSPDNFEAAKVRVRTLMDQVADNAARARTNVPARRLQDLGLARSYRTAQPVLTFVDRAIGAIGWQAFGLKQEPEPHVGGARPGCVALWPPVRGPADGDDGGAEAGQEPDGEGQDWIGRHDRQLADRIAGQIKEWLDRGFALYKGTEKEQEPRRATPGDIMVLVRKRRELAGLIVARLHVRGVPVAGVDRLRLGNPLAVKDLLAALRFASQPLDDLSLACLLVSPIIGWSQDDLLAHGYRPERTPLWEHLRESDDPLVMATVAALRGILARADFDSPQALLHWLLTGPLGARRKLVARLGREANDPIDELLNAAQAYAAAHTASLAGFLQWFDAGDGELKREAGERRDEVRVMTVHGSKGLESPIVILADAAGGPGNSLEFDLVEQVPGGETGRTIPLPGLSKEDAIGPLAAAREAEQAAALEEHWRLLYVAMTRAEEALFIAGSLGPRDAKNGPHPDSWHARLEPLFEADWLADERWGGVRWWGDAPRFLGPPPPQLADEPAPALLPAWAGAAVGPEPNPPRPLAPSAAGEERGAEPPLPPDALEAAARRGVLIHRLLERLPEVPQAERAARGASWLARRAGELDAAMQNELLAAALRVLEEPAFADVFGPGALAEVPLAATVDGQVIAGTVDRLLVTPEAVTVVDFKTARRPPGSLDAVPLATLRQMAAYAAALGQIFPGRTVRAALLYTQTPQLIAIPAPLLVAHKPQLSTEEQSLDDVAVE